MFGQLTVMTLAPVEVGVPPLTFVADREGPLLYGPQFKDVGTAVTRTLKLAPAARVLEARASCWLPAAPVSVKEPAGLWLAMLQVTLGLPASPMPGRRSVSVAPLAAPVP